MPDHQQPVSTRQALQKLADSNRAVNEAQIELFRWIVECDLRRVYRDDGCDDMARWVSLQLGISMWKARRWLTAAYALDELPLTTETFASGELSLDKLVELTRFATRADEQALLRWATRVSAAAIRDRADRERRASQEELEQVERSRSLTWWWQEESSMLSLQASLPADQGLKLTAAIDRLADRLADAPDEDDPVGALDARRADALVAMASAAIAGDGDADRATVVVHAEVDALVGGDRSAVAHGGKPLHPKLTEMLTCDSRLQLVLHGPGGRIEGIGSPAHITPRWIRRQVEHRDAFRCTFPNCDRQGFTQVHHIVPWPRGRTEPDNLVLLCPHHHRLIHVFGWHVSLTRDGISQWFRRDWTPYQPRAGYDVGVAARSATSDATVCSTSEAVNPAASS